MLRRVQFREKLRRLGADRNKSKAGVEAGLAPTAISSYIAKKSVPRADIALKIARAFQVPLDWLVDDAQDWPAPEGLARGLSDDELLAEICRRYERVAGQLQAVISRCQNVHWPTAARHLLERSLADPDRPDDGQLGYLVQEIQHAKWALQSFDGSARYDDPSIAPPGEARPRNGPLSADTLLDHVAQVRELPGFDAVKEAIDLRFAAASFNRQTSA
jgi:transcriptional regulator with XRE-family HTH domain